MVATVNDILATIPTETRQALMAQMVSLSANPDTDAGEAIALQSSNTDTSNGTLRIAMECAYAPFNWTQTTDANGAVPISGKDNLYASGYDVQVAKYIAAELGMALEVYSYEWDSLIAAVQSGAGEIRWNLSEKYSESSANITATCFPASAIRCSLP